MHDNHRSGETAPRLTVAERKARLAALVESGQITPARAALIDLDCEPSPAALAYAKTLLPRVREILARGKRAAA